MLEIADEASGEVGACWADSGTAIDMLAASSSALVVNKLALPIVAGTLGSPH